MLKVYLYKGCGSCQKAAKWLKARGLEFEAIPIREQPPTVEELRAMLAARGNLRSLFNTSGQDYRSLGMKEKLPTLSEEDALTLLSKTGNLVKRPFVLDADRAVHLVGFREEEWNEALG